MIMKKNYFVLFAHLFTIILGFGQELLLNGGFESWDNSSTPINWTTAQSVSQEAVNVHSGSYSAMQIGGTKYLGQRISGIVPGESYTVTIWYKVGIEGDGKDVRIWSKWATDGINDSSTDANVLQGVGSSGYLPNNSGVWSSYSTTVIAPVSVNEFYFEVRTYSGATVYWDDFSFFHNSTAAVIENQIEGFAVYPNPVINAKFAINTKGNTTKQVSIYSLIGKEVYRKTIQPFETVNVPNLNSGIYMLRVIEDGKTSTRKLVVK